MQAFSSKDLSLRARKDFPLPVQPVYGETEKEVQSLE